MKLLISLKIIALVFSFSLLYSCKNPDSENEFESEEVPELVLIDSLVVGRMTQFILLDVQEDLSSFLLYDWKTKEMMNVSPSGEVKAIADLNGDGKNSYQDSYFVGARYKGKNNILIQTYTGLYTYDLDFNLIEKQTDNYDLVTRTVGGSRGFDIFGDYLYTFSIEEKDLKEVYNMDEFSTSYPFFTIREINSYDIIKSIKIPDNSYLAENPGFYNNLDPILNYKDNSLYVIYPNSPEMYVYNLPNLDLTNSFGLNPGGEFKAIKPHKKQEGSKGFFNSLAAGEYQDFIFSNGYLLTIYKEAAPQDEVDALPPDAVGGSEFSELRKKYKSKSIYQIFKEEEKIWEGQWDINLQVRRNLIYSNAKIGEDPNAVEKDVQTLYFYELR